MTRTFLLLAALLVACGGPGGSDAGTGGGAGGGGGTARQPQIGETCGDPILSTWAYVNVCQGKSWLTCERGTVAAFTCSGPIGCALSSNGGDAGQQLSCDFSGAVNGEACPTIAIGRAYCGADAGYWMMCSDGGTFVEKRCASPCYQSGGSVFCN